MLSHNEIKQFKFPQRDDTLAMLIKHWRSKKYKIASPDIHLKKRNRSCPKNHKKNSNLFNLDQVLLCSSFCSKKCMFEDVKIRKKLPPSINGLNCDKVDTNLYASQRLTNEIIKKYDLINVFKKLNIGLIVNTELKGEHPLCSESVYENGLDESGFAYSTKLLEKENINVLLCGWIDMTSPENLFHMVKIVKKMYYYIHVLKKNVLVHCHAGIGRTMITCACYKIFEELLSLNDALKIVRKGMRARCLGMGDQHDYCADFADYIKNAKENFYSNGKKTLKIIKIDEKVLEKGERNLINFDKKYFDYVPLFLLYLFDSIVELSKNKEIDLKELYKNNDNLENKSEEKTKLVEDTIKEINNYNFEILYKLKDLGVINEILFKWFNNSINYVIPSEKIEELKENEYGAYEKIFDAYEKETLRFICEFLALIQKNDDKNNELIKVEFYQKLAVCLFGEKFNKKANDETKNKLTKKFCELLNYITNSLKK